MHRGIIYKPPEDGIIGDPNPDWVANLINTLSYKNFSLELPMELHPGRRCVLQYDLHPPRQGLIAETTDREDTYILPGVGPDGNPNRVQINNSDYWF